jgi:hypothetical protein
MSRLKLKDVDVAALRRAKYLDARAIGGSRYVIADGMYRAPFPQGSADLRAAAEKALLAELEFSLTTEKKKP